MKTFEDWLNSDSAIPNHLFFTVTKFVKQWAICYVKELLKKPKLSNLSEKVIEEGGKTLTKYFVDIKEVQEEVYFYKYNENGVLLKDYERRINIAEWIKHNFNITDKEIEFILAEKKEMVI